MDRDQRKTVGCFSTAKTEGNFETSEMGAIADADICCHGSNCCDIVNFAKFREL
jgi:hypothetical protein